ncbi:hypothetical protein MP228_004609 [Amoeboaphelidium protococcarum]|nr:hypothetical protein MP228_004609 [Amoeboaphelidium protococcarum]
MSSEFSSNLSKYYDRRWDMIRAQEFEGHVAHVLKSMPTIYTFVVEVTDELPTAQSVYELLRCKSLPEPLSISCLGGDWLFTYPDLRTAIAVQQYEEFTFAKGKSTLVLRFSADYELNDDKRVQDEIQRLLGAYPIYLLRLHAHVHEFSLHTKQAHIRSNEYTLYVSYEGGAQFCPAEGYRLGPSCLGSNLQAVPVYDWMVY